MQLHNLTGKKEQKKRVGRGGKRGTYSGRGGKGQTARSGHRIRPAIRDFLKQIPKQRGRHKHSFVSVQKKPSVLDVSMLEKAFAGGDVITPKLLLERGLISSFGTRFEQVKVLGKGKLTKKFTVKECTVSAGAKKSIEQAGGKVIENK